MRRRLFTAVSVLSLVICAATVVLWVRGQRLPVRYWRQTFQSRGAVYGQDAFDNMRGVVAVCHFRGRITDPGSIAICERAAREGSWRWSRLDWMAVEVASARGLLAIAVYNGTRREFSEWDTGSATLAAGIASSPQWLESASSSILVDDNGSGQTSTFSVWNAFGISEARIEATHLKGHVPTAVSTLRYWSMPIAFLELGAMVLPAVWLIKRCCSNVRQRGHRCTSCGYDLRATPERCPECGAVPGKPLAATQR